MSHTKLSSSTYSRKDWVLSGHLLSTFDTSLGPALDWSCSESSPRSHFLPTPFSLLWCHWGVQYSQWDPHSEPTTARTLLSTQSTCPRDRTSSHGCPVPRRERRTACRKQMDYWDRIGTLASLEKASRLQPSRSWVLTASWSAGNRRSPLNSSLRRWYVSNNDRCSSWTLDSRWALGAKSSYSMCCLD